MIIYILQRGVQWKQGVVIWMVLYTSLLRNTTPIHCTPDPLHPPLQSIHNWQSQGMGCPFGPSAGHGVSSLIWSLSLLLVVVVVVVWLVVVLLLLLLLSLLLLICFMICYDYYDDYDVCIVLLLCILLSLVLVHLARPQDMADSVHEPHERVQPGAASLSVSLSLSLSLSLYLCVYINIYIYIYICIDIHTHNIVLDIYSLSTRII